MVMYLIPPVADGASGTGAPEGPYSHWTSTIHQYDLATATSLGFTVGSATTATDYRLLIMEVARTVVREGNDGATFEKWGYGYRLMVEASNVDSKVDVTFPGLAAAVELKLADATVRLEVNGYQGNDLWEVLPVPGPLTVETYNAYIAAAGRIQKAFADHPDDAYPVKLAKGSVSFLADGGLTGSEMSEAILVVSVLQSIREGQTRHDATVRLLDLADGVDDEVVRQLANAVYGSLGADSDGHPTDSAIQAASERLEILRR